MSSPSLVVAAASTLIAVILCAAYLPGLAEEAQLRKPWVSVAQAILAGILAIVASRHGARGPVGTLATLLDTALDVGSLSWAAVREEPDSRRCGESTFSPRRLRVATPRRSGTSECARRRRATSIAQETSTACCVPPLSMKTDSRDS